MLLGGCAMADNLVASPRTDASLAAQLVEHTLTHVAAEAKTGATTISIENVRKWLTASEFLKAHPADHHTDTSPQPDANDLIAKIRDLLGVRVGQNHRIMRNIAAADV